MGVDNVGIELRDALLLRLKSWVDVWEMPRIVAGGEGKGAHFVAQTPLTPDFEDP